MSTGLEPAESLRAGDIRFAYQRAGQGGLPIVLLHGWAADIACLAPREADHPNAADTIPRRNARASSPARSSVFSAMAPIERKV